MRFNAGGEEREEIKAGAHLSMSIVEEKRI